MLPHMVYFNENEVYSLPYIGCVASLASENAAAYQAA